MIFEQIRRVGYALQNPDMVGIAHPTDTDIFSGIKPDSYIAYYLLPTFTVKP